MQNTPLFRNAALEKCHVKWLGEIVLVRPLSFLFLTCAAVGVALVIVCFFVLGHYTQRSTVSGQLAPDIGVLKVYSPQSGIVVQKLVSEGQSIKKGAVLYVISSERQSNSTAGIQATVSQQVAVRQQSLRDEITRMRRLQQEEAGALHKKLDGLEAERSKIEQQITGQHSRVELAAAGAARAAQLLAQGFSSAEMAQQKQADLLDQRNRLETLEREKLSIEREMQAQHSELESMPLRQHNAMAQLERLLASTDQEWTESEGKRRIAIVAPEDGIATAIVAEVGQAVDVSRPLAIVIPSRATLQAHLYAPSRTIGFIRPADQVLLRYQAYPYQKFGHARGTVASVSRVALTPTEASGPPQNTGNGEQVYLITVTLARQEITAYGNPQQLQAGMLVEADILQDRRKLYEWALEPLFSLSGKL